MGQLDEVNVEKRDLKSKDINELLDILNQLIQKTYFDQESIIQNDLTLKSLYDTDRSRSNLRQKFGSRKQN